MTDHYEKIRRILAREICGECDSPINDDGTCDCTELLKHGWRQCAVGQKTTQWCAEAERIRGELREQRQRDEAMLRQVLEALKVENEALRAEVERLRQALECMIGDYA